MRTHRLPLPMTDGKMGFAQVVFRDMGAPNQGGAPGSVLLAADRGPVRPAVFSLPLHRAANRLGGRTLS
jgi:hypothetical protein